MESIYEYKLSDLQNILTSLGEKPFKAKQIFEWLYKKRVSNFYKMSNISKSLQEKLSERYDTSMLKIKKKQISDLTNKYLFALEDGNLIETVLMRHDYGLTG